MISVIIPVYNVEQYLEKCLISVLTNTYRDLQVICVNDGSTDSSSDILQKWQQQDSRIIVINQENRGLPEARNSGLEIAAGEYIAFVDSDDWVHPQYFQSMLNCMEQNNADMVICGCRKFSPGEEIDVNPFPEEPQYQKLTAKEFYHHYYARHMIWARLLRRQDAEKLRFPPAVDALQDTLYNLTLISRIKQPKVYETDSPLYFYLQRPGSLVRSRSYETSIQISEWYLKNERDPRHLKTGDWAWMLLLQSITMTLSCRYSAYLWKNRKLIRHTNSMLHSMAKDICLDSYINYYDKLTRMVSILFPGIYRQFRLRDDPSLKSYEQSIRKQMAVRQMSH